MSAILASTSPSITPLIATAKTSHEAWKKLKTLYVSRSRTRAMQLKEEFTLIQQGDRLITEYLHVVKALADEITIIDHSISDHDLTLYVLNDLGTDFWEIVAPIKARESSLSYEELHDLLVAFANFTKTKQSLQWGSHLWSFKQTGSHRGPQGSQPGRNSNEARHDGRRSNYNSRRPNNSN